MANTQERLDEVVISKPFELEEAISSLRFYWNLARHKDEKITMEIWATKDAIIPSKETERVTQTA